MGRRGTRQAVALGVLQGLTEAFPVSSSAHLRLATRDLPPAEATLLATALHLGSAVGTAWVLRRDLPAALRHPGPLVLATVPPVLVGGLAAGPVERRLSDPRSTAAALALGGLLLAGADRRPGPRRSEDRRDAAAVGLAQTAALVPGVSRSGAALTVLRWRGCDRPTAVRTATLLGLPVTAGAVLRAACRVDPPGARAAAAPLAAGAATAAVTTAMALPLAARLLTVPATAPALAAYRVVVGVLVARRGWSGDGQRPGRLAAWSTGRPSSWASSRG